jgi:Uma2 family endonuclease
LHAGVGVCGQRIPVDGIDDDVGAQSKAPASVAFEHIEARRDELRERLADERRRSPFRATPIFVRATFAHVIRREFFDPPRGIRLLTPRPMPHGPGATLSPVMHDALAEMSLDEWASMDEEQTGELVDGVLVEEEMPSYVHEVVVMWLGRILGNWLASRGGFVGGSEAKFAVGPRRGRKPDLTVFLPGRKPQAHGLIDIPPDIAIEIVSPTPRDERRDRVEKVIDYARFGVRWCWLVDPSFRTFEVLERGEDGRYVHAAAATDGPLDVPGCEGLVIDVLALWAELDRLER